MEGRIPLDTLALLTLVMGFSVELGRSLQFFKIMFNLVAQNGFVWMVAPAILQPK